MRSKSRVQNPGAWVERTIKAFINSSPKNTLRNKVGDKAWGDPLVGFSSGGDPLYQEFKKHIGSFHWTPLEIFTLIFPSAKVAADQLTVISWVLPHLEKTKVDNRKETAYPSERWARGRIFGEEVNRKLCGHVVATLQESGYDAIAPMLSPFFELKTSEHYGFASMWSERHAAYASGLGTFGLCDGLITPRGKAMRCGSVIAHITITPTHRQYHDHHAYCLFFNQGRCGMCIRRCPVGAITEAGHDKELCRNHLFPATADYVRSNFGFEGYGCGLCQTKVPCESKIPTREEVPSKKRVT